MPVIHCVFFKYRPEVAEAQIASVVPAFAKLQHDCELSNGERYIAELKCGDGNTSPEGHGKGFHHAYILTFADQARLDYYNETDPAHQAFKKFVQPLLADVFVYDFSPLPAAAATASA
ncbi:hypothetical protein OC835_001082 [Tilletia horrida]|nr:hypothetical protein OC835_001082 [Tilletia horrida]